MFKWKKVFSILLLQRFNSNNEFPFLELKTNPNNLQICTIFDSELCDAKNKFRIIKDNFKISGFLHGIKTVLPMLNLI